MPEGLYTKTQLSRLNPPRRLTRGAVPAGQVLYYGNRYAPLYGLDQTVEKTPPSAAQLASVKRAAAAQHICKRCDARTHSTVTDDNPPDPGLDVKPWIGRLCSQCRYALTTLRRHYENQQLAREYVLATARHGVIAVMADDPAEPRRLALVLFQVPQPEEMPELSVWDPPACRVCGCTDERACPGGCAWVSDPFVLSDLCSACWERSGGYVGDVLVDVKLAPPGTTPAGGEHSYADTIRMIDEVMRGGGGRTATRRCSPAGRSR
ncbi:hypothetical protein [Nonomuraea salmonea]|uniref:hypothetical protein n=1 Tax=Nonomuraea salmonea TaxID=46181 RepID=UPI002FECACCB